MSVVSGGHVVPLITFVMMCLLREKSHFGLINYGLRCSLPSLYPHKLPFMPKHKILLVIHFSYSGPIHYHCSSPKHMATSQQHTQSFLVNPKSQ